MAPTGLDDPYVRKNIYALVSIDWEGTADSRIAAALCRRGLLWEQPKDCWHLTDAGAAVLKEWDCLVATDEWALMTTANGTNRPTER